MMVRAHVWMGLLIMAGVAICTRPVSAQRVIEPVLICSPDMSCVSFSEAQVQPPVTVDDSTIVTAPSGGIRLLIGATTGSSFGNLFAGPTVAVEFPINRHLELDAHDNYLPVEQHIALGNGWANQAGVGGIVWLTPAIGVNGNVEYSQYHVSIAKHAEYTSGGITYRKSFDGMPVRFTVDYLRQWNNGIDSSGTETGHLNAGQFNNGIDATGTESSHLQGGQFNLDMRVACHMAFCVRVAFDFKVGRVLTQSNPQCDGTFGGPVTCPRTATSAGAFGVSVAVEFPRRRATETYAFRGREGGSTL